MGIVAGEQLCCSCIMTKCVWESGTAPLWTSCSIHLQLGLGTVIYGQDLHWEYFYSCFTAAGVNGSRKMNNQLPNHQEQTKKKKHKI